MRESKLYLKLFKRALIWLLLPGIILGIGSYYYLMLRPAVYTLSNLFEMSYTQEDVVNKVILADQAVSLIRSQNLQGELNFKNSSLIVFKPGPLLISATIKSADLSLLSPEMSQVTAYLDTNFPIKEVGKPVEETEKSNKLLGAGIGFGVGVLVGWLLFIVREYFRAY